MCFCGCGRAVSGVRPRANNEVAGRMSQHLAVLRGALERDEAGDRVDEVRVLVDEGTDLIEAIKRYLHGEISRGDLDRAATKAWLHRGGKMADSFLSSASGPAWEPDDQTTAHLAQSGRRASGVVTDVRRGGLGNDRVADLVVSVTIQPDRDTTVELTRKLSISVVKAPRVGDHVEVAYDPSERDRFVYRPLLEVPSDDRIGRLRELGDLLDQGLLTREEFDAEKARVLDR
jgi:hypothetical protein